MPRPENKNKKAARSVSFEDNFIANKADMENTIEPKKASETNGLINIVTIHILNRPSKTPMITPM